MKLFAIALALLCFSSTTFGLVNFRSTLSGGYYRDIVTKPHTTVFYDLEFNYVHDHGFETYFEMGLDNNFVQDTWGFYPYQFYVTVPIGEGFDEQPFYKSRLQFGRQLFTEGFEIELLDGMYLPYYISPKFRLLTFAGGIHTPEEQNVTFKHQIYGGSVLYHLKPADIKVGLIRKQYEDFEKNLSYGSALIHFDALPLHPMTMVKGEWDLEKGEFEQGLAELRLLFGDKVQMTITNLSRRPDPVPDGHRSFIYQLLSLSPAMSTQAGLNWQPSPDFDINTDYKYVNFQSPHQLETGRIAQLGFSWHTNRMRLSPTILRMDSYGGHLWNFECDYRQNLSDNFAFRLGGDIAQMEKINGITGRAYQGRTGMEYRLSSTWMTLLSLVAERNHLFEFDTRGVIYVSHFYH